MAVALVHTKESDMIVKNIQDVDSFFKTVDRCEGRVEMVTKDGDRLNLKSKLSQYVSLTSLFRDTKIHEVELVVEKNEDVMKMIRFMMAGQEGRKPGQALNESAVGEYVMA